ncbi:hypothetical protein Cgig2_003900 [Carnegiea gigantea]|uniref:Uncharacterized protein n=1 Tax=Carnegiea gigantea TaxID=171969 RepID=A0A9Q1JGV2_9CARY|nr:hypothetical protein Cgig2_003900 [Carnegiea gigantea]
MAFPPFRDTEEMPDHVRETFKWHLRRASCPPHPLLEDYRDLCPSFTLLDAKEVARDFNIPEIVEATFYTMVVNDVVELSVVSRDVAGDLKSTLKGLRWTTFESWLSVNKRALLEAQRRQWVPPGGQRESLVLNPCTCRAPDLGGYDPVAVDPRAAPWGRESLLRFRDAVVV